MKKKLNHTELKEFLDAKYYLYNKKKFIDTDPVSIPHRFTRQEDIEIAGFLAATIAWGQRTTILKNAGDLLKRMDNDPHQFVSNFSKSDLRVFNGFVHRTFNSEDLRVFLFSLQRIYREHGTLENLLIRHLNAADTDLSSAISKWKSEFFRVEHQPRTLKHFSDPLKGSATKRINMFLRWMVRKDEFGVDFGLWKSINSELLTCPLDIHSGRVARKLGLLKRSQNDWKAAGELTEKLKTFDASDPVKYDFALFGLGVFEKF